MNNFLAVEVRHRAQDVPDLMQGSLNYELELLL